MCIMKLNRLPWGIILIPILVVGIMNFLVEKYGGWTTLLMIVGGIALLYMLLKGLASLGNKPSKEFKKELHNEHSYEVAVPPGFMFSMIYDPKIQRLLSDNLIDIYIDREEVGGRIVRTFHTKSGAQTNYAIITQWNPPLSLETQFSIEKLITINDRWYLEKTEKGTRLTMSSHTIYYAPNKINLLIFSIFNRKSRRRKPEVWIKEVENEFTTRRKEHVSI